MKSIVKKRMVALLAGASALALGGALLCMHSPVAHAAEGSSVAFLNVGASADAQEIDATLGLKEGGVTASAEGTVKTGDTLFESYATNPTYSVALSGASKYRVAVIVKAGASVTINNSAAEITGEGKYQIAYSAEVTGSSATVAVTGDACAVIADDAAASPTLMGVYYTAGQVISYGALLADVLDPAAGYYSNGDIKDIDIEYGDIVAGTGVNVNFNTVEVAGTVKGTSLTVNRHLITMPDNLVYFINAGSHDYDNQLGWPETADKYYTYNQTVFDYYGDSLLNYGTSDRKAPSSSEWGWYGNLEEKVTHTVSSVAFPYSAVRCMDGNKPATLGYYLTGLEDSIKYRIWIGTLSPWHARTVNITFNGAVVGEDNLRVASSKGYTVFEDVSPSGGKIDIKMVGAETNEPVVAFIAVQEMSTPVAPKPAKLQGEVTSGMDDTSMLVSGVDTSEDYDVKLQIYNANKPNQMLHEEKVDPSKIVNGNYNLSWGKKFNEMGVSNFNVVQITNGGVSDDFTVAITDIELVSKSASSMFTLSTPKGQYTSSPIEVTVRAKANSGITQWKWRFEEYGDEHVFDLADKPYQLNDTFTAKVNGLYIVVVTSGIGVTREERITIDNIDLNQPEIVITPSKEGWKAGKYNVSLAVESPAPVTEYKLLKNGSVVKTANSAPSTVTFSSAGDYTIFVKTASGMTNTKSFRVSAAPSMVKVTKEKPVVRTLTFNFLNTEHYELAGITAYLLTATGAQRQTTLTGEHFSVTATKAGTYVVIATMTTGETEVFSFNVGADDLKKGAAGVVYDGTGTVSGGGAQLGIGIGVMVGGIVLAAAAVVVTLLLLKKKKAKAAEGEQEAEETNEVQE